jgi:proline iminopeptidase
MGRRVAVRDVNLFVKVVGHGSPLLPMHGGPGADHWSLAPRLAGQEAPGGVHLRRP